MVQRLAVRPGFPSFEIAVLGLNRLVLGTHIDFCLGFGKISKKVLLAQPYILYQHVIQNTKIHTLRPVVMVTRIELSSRSQLDEVPPGGRTEHCMTASTA